MPNEKKIICSAFCLYFAFHRKNTLSGKAVDIL